MEKQSKINMVQYKTEWQAPNNAMLYIHELTMANGDVGNIYCKSQYPAELAVGNTITYDIDDKKKIKVLRGASSQSSGSGSSYSKGGNASASVKFADIVNYAFSYAKDLEVARISAGLKPKDSVKSIIAEGTVIFEAMNALRKKMIDDERTGSAKPTTPAQS